LKSWFPPLWIVQGYQFNLIVIGMGALADTKGMKKIPIKYREKSNWSCSKVVYCLPGTHEPEFNPQPHRKKKN
jgi:hypothetical protein